MSDQSEMKNEEIDKFLSESFMIIDELEDNHTDKTGKDTMYSPSDLKYSPDLATETQAPDEDGAEKTADTEVTEETAPQQDEENPVDRAVEPNNCEDVGHKDSEEVEEEGDTEIEEIASGETYNLDSSGVSKSDEPVEDAKIEETSVQEEEEPQEQEAVDTHPYLYLIESFELTKEQKTVTNVGPPKPFEETPLHIVNNRNQLLGLLQTLRSVKEIVVSLQVDNRAFSAPLCLLEISTRDLDYIIDAIKLKNELLLLTEIFLNPKIVKVIHKADLVLNYLQQHLHLFVVNVFDMSVAGKALNNGVPMDLIALLRNEYLFDTKLKLQNNDFRFRPISEGIKNYCRGLPHHFIHLYHSFKNRLLEDEKLYQGVMDECRNLCKVVYPARQVTQLGAFEEELKKRQACQSQILQNLFKWRESVARKNNKNPDMILNKRDFFNLVTHIPNKEEEVLQSCSTQHAKMDIEKIIAIIKEAIENNNIFKTIRRNRRERVLGPVGVPNHEFNMPRGVKRQNLQKSETCPNKQKRIEPTFNKTKNESPPVKQEVPIKQQSKFQNKPTNGQFNKNQANKGANFSQKPPIPHMTQVPKPLQFQPPRQQNLNKSTPPGTADSGFRSGSFLNHNAPKPLSSWTPPNNFNKPNTPKRKNKGKKPRFESAQNSTGPPPLLLKPTNVPSNTRFESFAGTFQEYSSPLGNFSGGQRDDGALNMYSQRNLMPNLQQGVFNQVFDAIDYKINNLERRVSKFQVTNDPNDMESNMFRRRYN